MMLLSACGKKTEKKLNDHDTKFAQTEQIDSLQSVKLDTHGERLDEQAEALKEVTRILQKHGISIENIDSINKLQTEKIADLYKTMPEFKEQLDKLNSCCNGTTPAPTQKPTTPKKPVT